MQRVVHGGGSANARRGQPGSVAGTSARVAVACLVAGLALAGCGPGKRRDKVGDPKLIFATDYEAPGASGDGADAHQVLTFENLAEPPDSSVQAPSPVDISVYYEDGTPEDRHALLVDDPTAPGNRVLEMWMKNAAIDTDYRDHTKGRIQTIFGFGDAAYVPTLYSRQRVRLHPDLGLLLDYPADGDPWWIGITLQELWLGASWEGDPNPGRISLNLAPTAEGAFQLVVTMEKMPSREPVWQEVAVDDLPLGEWLTLEVAYEMGNEKSGRFVVTSQTADDPEPRVLVDVHDFTYNPDADGFGGSGPVPLTHWNPQKLYTSDNVLHFIRDQGGVAQLLFDDFFFTTAGWPSELVDRLGKD